MTAKDTETRIIRAATKLFGQRGFASVSVREILQLAGANVASAHYYFGSKQDLFLAVTERFINQIVEKRTSNLAKVKELHGFSQDSVPEILRGYIEPHYAVISEPDGEDYLRVFSRFQSERERYSVDFFSSHFGASRQAYVDALAEALDPIDEHDLWRGFSIFVTAMLVSPFDYGFTQLKGGLTTETDYQLLGDNIVKFSAAGLLALSK